ADTPGDGRQLAVVRDAAIDLHSCVILRIRRGLHVRLLRQDPVEDPRHVQPLHARHHGLSCPLQPAPMTRGDRSGERTAWVRRIIILSGALLILQTGWLQLGDPTYKQRADRTTLVRKTQYPARGLIMDRNRHLLVYNIPVYDLKVTYKQVPKDLDTALRCQLLEIAKAE